MAEQIPSNNEDQDFNPDIYTLVDEEGTEQTFELLDVMDLDEDRYFALIPYFENPDELVEDDGELIVLKSQMDENGEELMVTIDDDDEYQRVGNLFLEKLSDMFDGDDE